MSETYTDSLFARDADFYLNRYNAYPQLCSAVAPADLSIAVILPCINEPDVITSLKSLYECTPPVAGSVEVIVLINASEAASEDIITQNIKTKTDVDAWIAVNKRDWIHTQCAMVHGLARKHAGAGWARKLAMDEAVRRFSEAANPLGVIASFDADAICSTNYFTEIERTFADEAVSGCSIHFEHRTEHAEYPAGHLLAIAHYELHLRYLTQAMKWAGAPYAFHTVGSSMAVRVRDYIKIGGMNRRQAGEDFYFLHKIIPRGRFCNLTKATVYPSARQSDRVPFGTGAAMRAAAQISDPDFKTYQFQSFEALRVLFANIDALYNNEDTESVCRDILSFEMCECLINNEIAQSVAHIKDNCASLQSFRTRFIEWFSAFRLIKYLNWLHSEKLERKNISVESKKLLTALGEDAPEDIYAVLETYRILDKKEF